jgi:OFA family oxalate/formate antiporter-like MFS transporter
LTDEGGSPQAVGNRWIIAISAVVMQMCLGVLYAWSVFRTPLEKLYHWDKAASVAPYRYSLLFFTLGMIVAGLWQDRKGPRLVGSVGGLLLGTGCLLAAFVGSTQTGLVAAYGVIGGLGVGFAYVTPIATCVKWFPDKRGLIVGLAVMGFGAGTVVFAPLLAGLIGTDAAQYGVTIPKTFEVMAVIMYIGVIGAAQMFRVPPKGWKPAGWNPPETAKAAGGHSTVQMLQTWQFYALWALFALGASVGLTAIGEAKPYMERLGDPSDPKAAAAAAAAAVGILSLFNGGGRLIWGAISDKLGRKLTTALMGAVYVIACAFFLRTASSYTMGLVGLCMVGLCFGGYLAIMPAFNADFYGAKNFGLNYGLQFSAYGLSGFFVPYYFSEVLKGFGKNRLTEGYAQVFTTLAIVAVVAVVLAVILRKPPAPEAEA